MILLIDKEDRVFQPILSDLDRLMDPKTLIGKHYLLPQVKKGFEVLTYIQERAPERVE